VKALVIDIRIDQSQADDAFMVDTNVWNWLFYNPNPPPYSQDTDYVNYISKARSSNSYLAYSGISLAELAHIIEREERNIFGASSSYSTSTKQYRHNYPTQRANVVSQVQTVWNQMKAIAVSVNIEINEKTTDNALTRFATELLDGYDLFILETMEKEEINNIITDDGDYCTVHGITVFTANRNVINAATSQGKLLTR
jgi:predicted nucleic acid-binding protein